MTDLAKTLKQLRQELADLDAAIETLERLQASRTRGPGRPRKKAVGDPRTEGERDAQAQQDDRPLL